MCLFRTGGNVVAVEVSHAARFFDQLEVGDQVKALDILKTGDPIHAWHTEDITI